VGYLRADRGYGSNAIIDQAEKQDIKILILLNKKYKE